MKAPVCASGRRSVKVCAARSSAMTASRSASSRADPAKRRIAPRVGHLECLPCRPHHRTWRGSRLRGTGLGCERRTRRARRGLASGPARDAHREGSTIASTSSSLEGRSPPFERSSRTSSRRNRRMPTGSRPTRREVSTSIASSSVHGSPMAARRIRSSGATALSLCSAVPSPREAHGMSEASRSERILPQQRRGTRDHHHAPPRNRRRHRGRAARGATGQR